MATKTYPKYGDKNAEVTKIQKLLAKAGSTIKASGVFNIGTTSAITAFQKKNKLNVTGKLDAKTVAALEKFAAVKKTTKKAV